MPETAERTALYRLYNVAGDLLYVGISNNPENRLRGHRSDKSWWHEVDGVSIHWFDTRYKASVAEAEAIAVEKPRHNRQGTEAHRARISILSKAIPPEKRRNRSVGLKARSVQMRTLRDLRAQGVPEAEAQEQAKLARECYFEKHRSPELP
ncbi:GIY-YIG nuclease family protein [Streptomyces sp. NPDC085946]|uniref:GIY-YIG nuclease family protein n=1 Tax=Streptomyces sp. NPDC085946 TaxID=3365744 RepID=UPI0037D2CD7B